MADGTLTPAVSVTSAVSGIGVAQPSVINSIVPISIAFLLVLFFVQQFGTARLAFTFSPSTFLVLVSWGCRYADWNHFPSFLLVVFPLSGHRYLQYHLLSGSVSSF